MCTAAKGRRADVAVIGSGPVGLKLALDLADAGLDVVLIDSGRDGNDPAAQALSDAEIADPARHAPMNLAVRRGLGGTSLLWGGRAVAFDAVDFAARDWLPEAAWPIPESEVTPWYEAASDFLDCGPPVFRDPFPAPLPPLGGLRLDDLERWCAQPDMRRVHGARVLAHPKIRVALGATATRLRIDPVTGTATSRP